MTVRAASDPAAFSIRLFRDADYEAIAALHNRENPEMFHTAAEWRRDDDDVPPHIRWGYLVAETTNGGDLIGVARYGQSVGMYHPQRFRIGLTVDADFRCRGVGSALYDAVLHAVAPYEPISLRTTVREDKTSGAAFARNRGFVETMRFWESVLDVAAFDFTPFAAARQRFADAGYTIRTAADLANDEQRDQKLYALWRDLQQDVPRPEPLTLQPFEEFQKRWSNAAMLTDAYFVALDADGGYMGSSNLWARESGDWLQTGLTGVRREYRRRGIALALKLEAIAYARARSVPRIRTDNESNNVPMLAINERLGFQREPAWVSFLLEMQPPSSAGVG
jgi:GNAT superfamily N-acetyltransferase